MNISQKIAQIFLNAVPIIAMILFINFVKNDWWLTLVYIIIIAISLIIKREKNDIVILCFGIVIMTLMELLFTSTSVEFFIRASLFKLIPVWLPFLWGYSFVAIKRSVLILNN